MTTDEIGLDLETAGRLLAIAGPALAPVRIERLTGGGNSAVFDVETADGARVVVKLYSDLFHWKMAKEVYVYGLLRRSAIDVPLPTVILADDSKTLHSQSFIVLTKLDGRPVLSLLDEIDDDALVGINRQIGGVLRRLHEVRFDEFGYIGVDGVVGPHRTNADYMRFQFEKKLREFAELGGDPSLHAAINDRVAAHGALFVDCPHAVLCHDDCHEGNVHVLPSDDGWIVSGLLDVENAVAGDPLLDLAKAYCYSRRRSEAGLAALAEGYGSLRADWRPTLDLYVLYHWLELWDWFATIGTTEPLAGLAGDLRELATARR